MASRDRLPGPGAQGATCLHGEARPGPWLRPVARLALWGHSCSQAACQPPAHPSLPGMWGIIPTFLWGPVSGREPTAKPGRALLSQILSPSWSLLPPRTGGSQSLGPGRGPVWEAPAPLRQPVPEPPAGGGMGPGGWTGPDRVSLSVAGGWETQYLCCSAAVGSTGCQVAKVGLLGPAWSAPQP